MITDKSYPAPSPTITLNFSGFSIPANTYLDVIYTGATGNIILPNTSNCLNGQTIDIRNNGTGILAIDTQALDILQIDATTQNITYSLAINANLLLNCDNINNIWTIMKINSDTDTLYLTNLETVNLSGNPVNTNINVVTNLNLANNKILMDPIAIGNSAGTTSQSLGSVAIGPLAGNDSQSVSIAIGFAAGVTSQGNSLNLNSIAIGAFAAQNNQFSDAIAVGTSAAQNAQNADGIALGNRAAELNQGSGAIAVGTVSGGSNQGMYAISVNNSNFQQGDYSISMGNLSASSLQSSNAIAIGTFTGRVGQKENSIHIGNGTATDSNQGFHAIHIGTLIGENSGDYSIGIGTSTGQVNHADYHINIGTNSAINNNLSNSIAIGVDAAGSSQGKDAVAIGNAAQRNSIADYAVHIGASAGLSNTGIGNIGIGSSAGCNAQGNYAIAIGRDINTVQANNSIILSSVNATTTAPTIPGAFCVRSVRSNTAAIANMVYDSVNSEIYYTNTSDIRIKKNIETMSDTECFNIIKNLEVKKYNYIDERTPYKVYGFIAQDVITKIPEAVEPKINFLPDIWLNCNSIVLSNQRLKIFYSNVTIEQKIKVINNNTNDIYICEIESIESDSFTTKKIINLYPDENTEIPVFIYGKEVNNCLALQKEYLWAVKWGAIRYLLNRAQEIEQNLISKNL